MVNHIGTWLFCAPRSSEPDGGGNRCVEVCRCLANRRLLGQGAAVGGMRKVEAVGLSVPCREANGTGMTERSDGFSERVWD